MGRVIPLPTSASIWMRMGVPFQNGAIRRLSKQTSIFYYIFTISVNAYNLHVTMPYKQI